MNFTIEPLGDRAVIITFPNTEVHSVNIQVRRLAESLENEDPWWCLEFVPAYTTVTIYYNPNTIFYHEIKKLLTSFLSTVDETVEKPKRRIKIPVCYEREFGPDLPFVAKLNGISIEDVIRIHTAPTYTVQMLGFAPGFPFLSGMSEQIAAPRKETPRLQIPAGSVGIAGKQTGIYPLATPGGWQIIGRTPVRLFLPEKETPTLLRAGDEITFYSISREEYERLVENK